MTLQELSSYRVGFDFLALEVLKIFSLLPCRIGAQNEGMLSIVAK